MTRGPSVTDQEIGRSEVSNLQEPTLSNLWRTLYDGKLLERLDLSREWSYVEANPELTLTSFIRGHCPTVPDEYIDVTSRVVRLILDGGLSNEDRTLLAFNLIPLLEHYIRDGNGRALEPLHNLVSVGIWRHPLRRALPIKASIELTNSCNLNCVMCGVGSGGFDPSRTMTLSLFRGIIRKLGPTVRCLRLNGLGESTVIPDFNEYLRVLVETPARLELVTNLSFDNEELLTQLLDLNMLIFVSCDSTRKDRLIRIRRNLNYDVFLNNLKGVSDYVQYHGRNKLDCQIIMTLMESNFRELPDMVDFAHRYGLGGVIGNMVKDGNGAWRSRRIDEIRKTFAQAARRAEEVGVALKVPDQIEGIPLDEDFVSKSNARHCPTLMEEVFIRYNGDVCPCNMMNPYIYGNLVRNGLEEVVNSINARMFYALSNTGIRHPYCVNCYYMR